MSVVSPRNGPTPSEEDNSLLWMFGAIASKPESQNQPEIIKNSQKSQIVLPTLLQTPVYSSIGPQSHFQKIHNLSQCLMCEELPVMCCCQCSYNPRQAEHSIPIPSI